MINYRYKINTDLVQFVNKPFFVTLTLPGDFSVKGKKAKIYSPDLANPRNVKIQKISPEKIKLKVPLLKYYNLLVIE